MISLLHVPKGITIICIALFGSLSLTAQTVAKSTLRNVSSVLKNTPPEIQPLSIGDKVPNIQFENVLNYKSKKAKLSDFKGKLVILDMWSRSCTSCIAAFPGMEKLQNEFKDKIQILLVNPHDPKYDSEEKIKETLKKLKIRTGLYPSLPIPIHDSILNTYFPHQSVPHQVWIDASRKVIAITGSMDVTSENIAAILEGKEVDIPVKNDWAFDQGKPLLVDNNGGLPGDFVFRSLFTGFRNEIGVAEGFRRDKNNQLTGFYLLNHSLRELIFNAYSDLMNRFPESRIVLEVKNPEKYKLEFEPANIYCYDLTILPIPSKLFDQRKYLKEDLKRCFNISVHKEKRKMKCLVITVTDKIDKIFNSSTKHGEEIDIDESTIKKYMHNFSVADAIKSLYDRFDIPLIDETGISQQRIDIDFPDNFDLRNQEKLMQVLRLTGFDIKREMRELEVIVISDIQNLTDNSISNRANPSDIKEQIQLIKNHKKDASLNYLLQNSGSQYAPIVISDLLEEGNISFDLASSLFEKLEKEVQNSLWGKIIKAQIDRNDGFYISNTSLPGEFKISGSVAGLKKGDTLFVLHRKFESDIPDTIVHIVNGQDFSFTMRAFQGPSFYRIKKERNSEKTLLLFLDNTPIIISGNTKDFELSIVTGSKSQAEQQAYNKLIKPYDIEINKLYLEMKNEN